VCGDSPFVDVACLDGMLVMARNGGVDYLRVTDTLNGFISEVFTLEALERSMFLDDSPTAREHVTPALSNRSDIFRHYLYPGPPVPSGYSFPQLTVDTADDLYIVRRMYAGGVTYHTKAHDILKVLQKTPPYSQAASL
jgi:spore coat polysaccharide biosynthesis protein SpsF (cytidylyltransferase family)